MVKRIVLGAGLATVLGLFFFGRDAVSYVSTSAAQIKESVKSAVPIEFEIDRARKMVQNLVPDIQRNMHVIAKEEVEVEKLDKQIAETEKKLTQQKSDVVRLRTDLSANHDKYEYAGRTFTCAQVKTDLAARFERYKTNEATLDSLKDILAARQQSLEGARQKLAGMLASKRQLEVEAENLEARLKMVEVAQTTSDYNFDDSRLARVKDLMNEIRARLGVAEKLVNADHQFEGEIPLNTPTASDIVDQVTEYFQLGESKTDNVAQSAH